MIDNVNHPKHYVRNGLETIDVIEAFTSNLTGYEAVCTANALKYLCRWKEKNGVEDLKKAEWYLKRLISKLEYVDTDTVDKDVDDSLYKKFHKKLQALLRGGMSYSDAVNTARRRLIEESGIDPITGDKNILKVILNGMYGKHNYGFQSDPERFKEIINDKLGKHS